MTVPLSFVLLIWLGLFMAFTIKRDGHALLMYDFHGQPGIWDMSPESDVPFKASEKVHSTNNWH